MAIALFPGSFDPFHLGHLWIAEWAAGNYDEVVVAVLGNPDKPSGMFSSDERVRLATLATEHLPNVRCLAFYGLTGSLAQEQHADVIVRSAHKEADTERLLAVLNRFMSRGVPTQFAPANPSFEGISSTMVRDLLESGDTDAALQLVPEAMRAHLPSAPRLEPAVRRAHPAGRGTLTMGQRVSPLRVAAVQDAPAFLDRDATLDKTLTLVERAAGTGAQLVVFPETFIAGYPEWVWRIAPVDDHASALYALLFDNAVVVGSAVTQVLGLAAQRYGVYLSVGITERETAGSTLYATQLLFGPDGALCAVHRKLMPSGAERLVWGMGDGSGLAVVETPFGRIGTLTHGENYMPLARAALYAQGIDIYLAPTWGDSAAWSSTLRHIALEGGVFVVGVSSCLRASDLPPNSPGRERLYGANEWLARGSTMVVDPTGQPLTGLSAEETGIVTADLDANRARHLRQHFDPSGHDNRPDVFQLHVHTAGRSSTVDVGHQGADAPDDPPRAPSAPSWNHLRAPSPDPAAHHP